jgi:hypothetical protein
VLTKRVVPNATGSSTAMLARRGGADPEAAADRDPACGSVQPVNAAGPDPEQRHLFNREHRARQRRLVADDHAPRRGEVGQPPFPPLEGEEIPRRGEKKASRACLPSTLGNDAVAAPLVEPKSSGRRRRHGRAAGGRSWESITAHAPKSVSHRRASGAVRDGVPIATLFVPRSERQASAASDVLFPETEPRRNPARRSLLGQPPTSAPASSSPGRSSFP